MDKILDFVGGPLFTAAFLFMALGLLRLVILQIYEITRVMVNTRDKTYPWSKNFKEFFSWAVPGKNHVRVKPIFSVASFIFHIGLVLVPIFFVGHLALWKSGLGMSGPAAGLNYPISTALTIVTIAAGVFMLCYRIFSQSMRFLSGFMDYFLLVLLLVPFITGFLMVHPALLPVSYNAMYLVHMLSAELVIFLIPLTKMAHVILYPFDRFSSDLYWRLTGEGSHKVAEIMRGDDLKA